ncbi:hypothetical protein ABW13_24860 [Pluralibacter gergoviae]|nr:hypothetical protein ABW13_24860 [Pluralibacter gergoviae]
MRNNGNRIFRIFFANTIDQVCKTPGCMGIVFSRWSISQQAIFIFIEPLNFKKKWTFIKPFITP